MIDGKGDRYRKESKKRQKEERGIFIDKLDLKRNRERIDVHRYIVIPRRQ